MNERIERKLLEESLRSECEATIGARADRYLQVKPHGVVPLTHFAGVSAECTLLFRDGHYYGCISLAQSVAEALVQFMCKCNSFKPARGFEKNVQTLATRGFIPEGTKTSFLAIWSRRDKYHHLNASIETDRVALQELALEKARLLADIESKVFHFSIVDGALNPSNPQYWDIRVGDHTQVYLKLGL